ncbi:MAG: MBL fold metallo-hydrolase [Lachnospiraceae bacterium]|nr:MBL fold metallo-hydrolase [Lachnospiraceae bacterium]
MELCSIASGSTGNCIYAGAGSTRIMIDAGVSGKRIEEGLNSIGLTTKEMQGILVTHEHSDHVAGLGVVARKYGIPIYATEKTIAAIHSTTLVGTIDPALFHPVCPGEAFTLGDLTVEPMSISHDAADPVAYIMRQGGHKMAVVTDLGTYDETLVEKLQGLDLLLLEANHDIHMLQAGGYPYPLKIRILGEQGHLSNEASGQLLGRLLHDHFGTVLLGHLSRENNIPELAYEAVRQEIDAGENPYHGNDFPILVARRDTVSEVIRVS